MTWPNDGIAPEEAFELLGHETRLSILEALWEASRLLDGHEPEDSIKWYPGSDAVSFTDLRNRVGMQDGSQFNYHLEKLLDRFVHKTEEGYVLDRTGQRIVSIMRAEEFTDKIVFESEPIDTPCPLCTGEVVLESGTDRTLDFVFWRCTECDGLRRVPGMEIGVLGIMESLSPAGVRERSPDEVIKALVTWTIHRQTMAVQGVCPDCTGQVSTSLVRCHDHDGDGRLCELCGTVFGLRFHSLCDSCHLPWIISSEQHVLTHPTVRVFYREHGYEPKGIDFPLIRAETIADQTVLSEDPIQVRTTIAIGGDRLDVIIDGEGVLGGGCVRVSSPTVQTN